MAALKKALVIVESPAKAKKIAGFLGDDYIVRASMGHIRDLPSSAAEIPPALKKESWATLGVNVNDDFDPLYVVPSEKKKLITELKDGLKKVSELVLATDEDREGESIGWHLVQVLKPTVPVSRMTFSEITKPAILEAIRNTRQVDENLVQAQETRRVVDRLYGYTLSPLLWKKIARGLSAGRVQSVAVRLLVNREIERMKFRSGRFWDIKARLTADSGVPFEALLQSLGGRRIASGRDFDEQTGRLKAGADVLLLSEEQARATVQQIEKLPWVVSAVEQKQQVRRPYPPFTTSTMQQEANRKLGLSARQTMQIAQRLYEEGHITYMRTDSVNLSGEAIRAARGRVDDLYGRSYLSPEPRQFSTKTKGAQEAHEAIRPAGTDMRTAEELGLSGPEYRLYQMIWKRTMATQMADALLRFDTVTIAAGDAEFRATGRTVEFPGFFRAYVEGSDDPDAAIEDQDSTLPTMREQDRLALQQAEANAHETKPPARFTEATLVRTLESEGIGRPSTYASILSTIVDRGYVRKNGNQLIPTFTAMAVTRLLENYFPRLVDLGFTAQMEQKLDDIATGSAERLPYLREFYNGREGLDEQVKQRDGDIDPRDACTLSIDGLDAAVRVGRYGPYFEKTRGEEKLTASIPDTIAPGEITNEVADRLLDEKQRGPTAIGMHPEEGLPIYLKRGPRGPYLQMGEVTEDGKKPKYCSVPNFISTDSLDLPTALELLALPRQLGKHPLTGKVVNAGIGMFGPYVTHDKVFAGFDRKTHQFEHDGETYSVLNVPLDVAVEMLRNTRRKSAPVALKELGPHPEDQAPVQIFEGRYGPYVKHGSVNATVPKETDPASVTMEQALQWLAARAASGGKSAGRRGGAARGAKKAVKKAAKKAAGKAVSKSAGKAAKKRGREV
ncbi:MAG TPA: type I DNA topoisomerase [Planctomycetaceae bacterium]|nr:type I DNA topoisomerase [Planctomycetaceae bacterium]HBC61713.1 type I DNA topoisomerase [Planctomycetaceae bacterium]